MAGATLSLLVAAELARQALGPDALGLIDNVVRHDGPPPRAAAPVVRELLARPLDAADAAAIFARSLPTPLARIHEAEDEGLSFGALLARYVDELSAAQRMLRLSTGKLKSDDLHETLRTSLVSADQLLAIADTVDLEGVARANALFLDATARFARAVRHSPPEEAMRMDTPIGVVIVGGTGDDEHGPAALIVEPGGNDRYERAPPPRGGVSVIVDLAGNDHYRGADVAIGALGALIDFAGDDRYESPGPGLGAALAGMALIVDVAGNDRYEAGLFAQGAAAFGTGALVDHAGDDEYRLSAWGQGFGLAGGTGILWDRGGDDRYEAQGAADPFGRGALSGTQGAAFGFRTLLGGGVGILRDERGDDRYDAQMFAQGSGYYYGVGLLWDGAGNDRYRAVRYAQGNGAHQAVGVLRDEAGADRYELAYGVGQGMGLDLAVGALLDASGDDHYRARALAQGTATANGIGLLADAGGADRFHVEDRYSWGEAEPLRGLPSVGIFLHDAGKALLERVEAASPITKKTPCENEKAFPDLASLRRGNFDALYAAGEALRCALERGEGWEEAERLLERDAAEPLAPWIARALPAAPPERREKLREMLWRHPRCGVRAGVLTKERIAEALGSDCWQLQAAALRLGAEPGREVSLPAFLRARRAY